MFAGSKWYFMCQAYEFPVVALTAWEHLSPCITTMHTILHKFLGSLLKSRGGNAIQKEICSSTLSFVCLSTICSFCSCGWLCWWKLLNSCRQIIWKQLFTHSAALASCINTLPLYFKKQPKHKSKENLKGRHIYPAIHCFWYGEHLTIQPHYATWRG